MTRWEYTNIIITIPHDCEPDQALLQIERVNHQMNALGEKGWELAVQNRADAANVDVENKGEKLAPGYVLMYTFKRQKTDTQTD